MKTLLIAITLLTSFSASASCLFGETSGDFGSSDRRFDHLVEKSLEDGIHFTRSEINLIKKYHGQYENEEVSFSEIREYYADGYDELHTLKFIDRKTKRTYTYVWGYPGDNEAGMIFDRKGRVVAEVGDGDVYNCKIRR